MKTCPGNDLAATNNAWVVGAEIYYLMILKFNFTAGLQKIVFKSTSSAKCFVDIIKAEMQTI